MSKALFITGTGTDIGKTYVSGLITKKLIELGKKTAYYKAAMSGNRRGDDGRLIAGDAEFVKNFSKSSQSIDEMCPYVYENAYSPHLAARIEENPVEMEIVKENYNKLKEKYEYINVEGSGGICCPIRFDEKKIFLTDIIKELDLACLVVADAGLGTINNVKLTIDYMKQKNIKVKGIIFNNYDPEDIMQKDNIYMSEYMTGIKVIACVKKNAQELEIDEELFLSLYE